LRNHQGIYQTCHQTFFDDVVQVKDELFRLLKSRGQGQYRFKVRQEKIGLNTSSLLNGLTNFDNKNKTNILHINAAQIMGTRTQFGKRAFSDCGPIILKPDSSSHQEPSFCFGFSQSSQDICSCNWSRHCKFI